VPVAFRGAPQRHFYLALPGRLLAEVRPDVTFLEAEPYSIVASQWRRALKAKGIPFGVQIYENIDRPLPRAVRRMRSRVLADAAFVAARSETAGRLACAWGARGLVGLAPPAVPGWESPARGHGGAFTIGYAGRLVASKGLMDLLAAARMLGGEVELRFIGDGELKGELERRGREAADGLAVRVLDDVAHEEMASAYASLDVLVLPSRTTPTWKEQFGRVIVEALWCGVPVVGSDSGEIPWLIGLTGGGMVFPEGDVGALAERLRTLRADPGLRERLASSGRGAVERLFSIPAAADSLERLLLAAMRGDEEGAAGG
jgi:glycosyltransferase involved in cell wall biosynthesis